MPGPWEEHSHDAVVHSHGHYHVTHNFNERTGGFEHLSSHHEHEHDHAALAHGHFPHQDFEQEHAGEAHVHDHDTPVADVRETTASAPARKAAGTRQADPVKKAEPVKKAAPKKAPAKATAKKSQGAGATADRLNMP